MVPFSPYQPNKFSISKIIDCKYSATKGNMCSILLRITSLGSILLPFCLLYYIPFHQNMVEINLPLQISYELIPTMSHDLVSTNVTLHDVKPIMSHDSNMSDTYKNISMTYNIHIMYNMNRFLY